MAKPKIDWNGFCPKCKSDDIDIVVREKNRIHITCYHCDKGSYIEQKAGWSRLVFSSKD